MPIRPEEIDQTLQLALKERLGQLFQQGAALDPVASRVRSAGMVAYRQTAKRYAGQFWTAGAIGMAAILTPPFLAGGGEGPAVLGFLTLLSIAIATAIAGSIRVSKDLNQYVNPNVMRAADELIAVSRAEKAYCEALAALVEAGTVLSETVQKEILQQLNELLASYRRLDAPVQRARAVLGADSMQALEEEITRLERQRESLSDPDALAMMARSIDLCIQRQNAAHSLAPAREKAEAQQELIVQTLASVQASLGRTLGARVGSVQADVGELQQSVLQVSTQTRAVEEAVSEVLALGVSG